MKAAVLHHYGEVPRFEDFADPFPGADELLVHVKAVALENVDRAVANGSHFASRQFMPALPAIVGFDGIGMLEDGRMIGFAGMKPPYGSIAEKAVIPHTHQAPVPDGISAVVAASAPSSALTALFPLKWSANLQAGETVLVNGATGFAGKLAVQVAKLLGAGRIVGTGRDETSLHELTELGADAVIDLKQSDQQISEAFKHEAGATGYHVILDFLWGHPTELLIETLIPQQLSFARHKVQLIQVGEMAGSNISLSAAALRTSGLEIKGAGSGLTPEAIGEGTQQVWEWLKTDQLRVDVEAVPLKDIETAWKRDLHGKRLVIVP